MLQTFVWQHCQWHCLQKCFCLKLPNSVRNAKKIFEAMPLAMLPTKSLQHWQDQMIRANENIIDIYENIMKNGYQTQWPESSGLGNVADF